ncbi:hypothetical protein KHQ06_11930 [Nocardia tengchongensis]|uniref:Uncharacterized protein n=1 Tax=Nocardia tengchongensis TaxID=2055889 RepID=A0ABX8CUF6_9NOCA|nr:hypothetical protein [Nocardia tengchongensis]QVI23516.1 hypothetical protein KHQ06_11930 [Nocardia tengchongensis]
MEFVMIVIAAVLFVVACRPPHGGAARHHAGLPFAELEARLAREHAPSSARTW